ncbi:ADP-ribose pyrophosphatase [Magnetospirillum sp. LM-5]|uniref:NUDIX hydrolase n=1 Tax=Magnetospirillum sp. LM-5 TaxID=2681466 RepID=UPI00137CEAFA|nr:NUDIX hydrolase [Magnetospirillum sp. LM-5]CAA7621487.1 ADP-ribose pyrophosphatase [Magnetospirillum sp. LM-5]
MQFQGPTSRLVPEGDDRERLVCRDCGFVLYENPKVIVGAVCTWEDRYLLCRRAIAPRIGFWTMPVGYMELHETTEQGAIREVWEEARATIEVDALLGLYAIPEISQVHMIYRGRMTNPDFAAGPESLEVGLFTWDEIPWDELAYPNVRWSLEYEREMKGRSGFAPRGRPERHAATQKVDKDSPAVLIQP